MADDIAAVRAAGEPATGAAGAETVGEASGRVPEASCRASEASGRVSSTPDQSAGRSAGRQPVGGTPTRPRVSTPTRAVIALAVITFAVLGYRRRWIADDGMIAVRTAREILAGNGPVYSPFERAEADTSTLWTWLTALAGWIVRIDVARVAVYLGLGCAVAGVALALTATARLYARTPTTLLLPAGILVPLAVSPFWDYATSGLETGLCTLWIGACWYLLVTTCGPSPASTLRAHHLTALVFGLAPEIRPEFALVGAVFATAAWLRTRPAPRRALALAATAGAIPLAYEVFRAGYYGTLLPLPALAKSAAAAHWSRGLAYATEFLNGYLLAIPLTILIAALAVHLTRSVPAADRITIAAPILAALLLGTYVVHVGGDFMHARMMLPVTFLFLLPTLLFQLFSIRIAAVAVDVLAVWAAAVALAFPVHYLGDSHALAEDEHSGYQQWLATANPDTSVPYRDHESGLVDRFRTEPAGTRLLASEGGLATPLNPALPGSVSGAVAAGRLGAVGAAVPLSAVPVDTLGLANPLGARITATDPGRPGHEKVLPWAWVLADYGDPAIVEHRLVIAGTPPGQVAAARRALGCGALRELADSTRRPMTPGRFWDNLIGAFGRTTLVVPADPVAAERKFCG